MAEFPRYFTCSNRIKRCKHTSLPMEPKNKGGNTAFQYGAVTSLKAVAHIYQISIPIRHLLLFFFLFIMFTEVDTVKINFEKKDKKKSERDKSKRT